MGQRTSPSDSQKAYFRRVELDWYSLKGGGSMEDQRVEKLKTMLQDFRDKVDEKVVAKLELDKCNRIIGRLDSFSPDCVVCEQHFLDLEEQIIQLTDPSKQLENPDYKQYKESSIIFVPI